MKIMTLAPAPSRPTKQQRPRPVPKYRPTAAPSTAVAASPVPPSVLGVPVSFPPVRPFSTDEYERMVEVGILPEDNAYEFLEGWVVSKMGEGPIHSAVMSAANKTIGPRLPEGWHLRFQNPVLTQASLPEPDVGVVRGEPEDYEESHPKGTDFGLAIEIADTSLSIDRNTKRPIYARAGVPIYWIIDLNARRLEVYTDPTGDVADPTYRSVTTLDETQNVSLILDGREVAQLPVRSLLPKRVRRVK